MFTYIRHVIVFSLVALVTTFSTHSAFADRDAEVRVLMKTTEGDITLVVYPNWAPITAGNFLKLVEDGTYNGGNFYRVVTKENDNGNPVIEVIQGGAPEQAEELEPIAHEVTGETNIFHKDGTISMARLGVGTATSEFFICIGDQPGLDFGGRRNKDGQGFAAFGEVVEGMDVVRKIQGLPTATDDEDGYTKGQMLSNPVTIVSVERIAEQVEE